MYDRIYIPYEIARALPQPSTLADCKGACQNTPDTIGYQRTLDGCFCLVNSVMTDTDVCVERNSIMWGMYELFNDKVIIDCQKTPDWRMIPGMKLDSRLEGYEFDEPSSTKCNKLCSGHKVCGTDTSLWGSVNCIAAVHDGYRCKCVGDINPMQMIPKHNAEVSDFKDV